MFNLGNINVGTFDLTTRWIICCENVNQMMCFVGYTIRVLIKDGYSICGNIYYGNNCITHNILFIVLVAAIIPFYVIVISLISNVLHKKQKSSLVFLFFKRFYSFLNSIIDRGVSNSQFPFRLATIDFEALFHETYLINRHIPYRRFP